MTNTNAKNNSARFTAWIMGDDGLEKVDLRDLPAERLAGLREDAKAHGDTTMMATIDLLL